MYDCTALLSSQEAKSATGRSSAVFFHEEKGTAVTGETYCQYFAGSISIAVAIYTGPAYTSTFQPMAASAQNLPNVPGVGDEARWSGQNQSFGARAGSTGVTIFFRNLGNDPNLSNEENVAITMAKLIISRL